MARRRSPEGEARRTAVTPRKGSTLPPDVPPVPLPPQRIPPPLREFKQRRAAATYEALLQAAATVFGRRGFDAAQTPEIAAEAGVSTGAFYRYFTDKRQAFVEMMSSHLQKAHEEVLGKLEPERFTGSGTEEAIAVALEVVFDHFLRHVDLSRVYLAMSLRDPEVEALRAEYESFGREALAHLIEQLIPRERVPDPRAAATVIQISVLEVAGERAGLRPRAPGAPSDASIRRALLQMLHRYLFVDAAPPAAAPPRKPRSPRR